MVPSEHMFMYTYSWTRQISIGQPRALPYTAPHCTRKAHTSEELL